MALQRATPCQPVAVLACQWQSGRSAMRCLVPGGQARGVSMPLELACHLVTGSTHSWFLACLVLPFLTSWHA
jgi:hypothetical protein